MKNILVLFSHAMYLYYMTIVFVLTLSRQSVLKLYKSQATVHYISFFRHADVIIYITI